jgi:hypothetical protein
MSRTSSVSARLADVVMMLEAPDAYNREYIAAACRSILGGLTQPIEREATDAPSWYGADEASAWANGYNAAIEALDHAPDPKGWRCPHDLGFDREIGPLGCRLIGHEMECVCEARAAVSQSSTDSKSAPFYGAQCPAYPNCTGGCGLGCTYEIERASTEGKSK